jgi:hypothetical protein
MSACISRSTACFADQADRKTPTKRNPVSSSFGWMASNAIHSETALMTNPQSRSSSEYVQAECESIQFGIEVILEEEAIVSPE